jgi:hypothetical protein
MFLGLFQFIFVNIIILLFYIFQALNELAEQQCMPVWFVGGTVDTISVSIPWSSLLSDSSYVEVSGLHLTVRPVQRAENCKYCSVHYFLFCTKKKV